MTETHRIPYVGGQLAQDAFYYKKKDESGNVTHVCKIREELRRFCIKLKLGKRHVKYDDEK